jgi:hypothetical protein
MKEKVSDKLLEVMMIYSLKQRNRWDELVRSINGGWQLKKKKNRRKMKKHGKTI